MCIYKRNKSLEYMKELNDDVRRVIGEYIPNMTRDTVRIPKILREVERLPRIRNTGFMCEMEFTRRRVSKEWENLTIEYPFGKNGYGSIFYTEVSIFKSILSRSWFIESLKGKVREGFHEIRRERFSFKSKNTKRKYYLLFRRFTLQ